jgi:threonine synthase
MSLPVHSLFMIDKDKFRDVYVLDETHNPTYSYKDRASMLVLAKALELGKDTICTASTGNAASSMSGLCAMVGVRSKIFVPKTIPKEKLTQIKMYGADVEKIDGCYDDAYDISIDQSRIHGWYNRNTAYNPLTTEGKKSGAFDIFLQMNCKAPDKVFVPTGDGSIISGIYKGFFDLKQLDLIEKMPQLIAVQAEGSSGIIDYIETGKFTYKESDTLADSISVNAPRNLYMAAHAVKNTDGFGIKVNDDEILQAEKYLSQKYGYFVEPSAAAAWAGFIKYNEQSNSKGEKIVILLTGSGLKDVKNAQKALLTE